MADETPRYWFPAKRRGWGWGPPVRPAGWIFLLAWTTLMIAASPFVVLRGLPTFALFSLAMIGLLFAVCHLKGEPPKWRWEE